VGKGGFQEDRVAVDVEGSEVDEVVDGNQEDFLVRVFILVGIFGAFPKRPFGEEQGDFLGGNVPIRFEPFIFFRIRFEFRLKEMFA
jgi:hypothetical protein